MVAIGSIIRGIMLIVMASMLASLFPVMMAAIMTGMTNSTLTASQAAQIKQLSSQIEPIFEIVLIMLVAFGVINVILGVVVGGDDFGYNFPIATDKVERTAFREEVLLMHSYFQRDA